MNKTDILVAQTSILVSMTDFNNKYQKKIKGSLSGIIEEMRSSILLHSFERSNEGIKKKQTRL